MQNRGERLESGTNLRVAKTQQSKSQTARRTRTGCVAEIASEVFRNHIRQVPKTRFKLFHHARISPLLGTKHTGSAALAGQRILHVTKCDDYRIHRSVRRLNPGDLSQVCRNNRSQAFPRVIEKLKTERLSHADAAIFSGAASETD